MSVELHQGNVPLLISIPHCGVHIPADLQANYLPRALAVEDTDWHLQHLYSFAQGMGASVLTPQTSRYVIDLNRPPNDAPMYPGAANTELCPTRFFTGEPLYREGCEPDLAERERRRERHWQPYHDALQSELNRIKAAHGFALLWDAHSIRSEIPWLFDGRLPDMNIGTANGEAAHASIAQAAANACAEFDGFSHVVNGRFKGGYITRHCGQPAQHVHAVQLEMCQSTYMQEHAPFAYDEAKAAAVQAVVQQMLVAALGAAKALYAH
jgi:N-formylglutamate deformylase